jgi:hypothetical protein
MLRNFFVALVVGLATAQAAEPTTLTLACQGTTTSMSHGTNSTQDLISMGIIANLTDRTIQGFGYPGEFEVIKIIGLNDVIVTFFGGHNPGRHISDFHLLRASRPDRRGGGGLAWLQITILWHQIARSGQPHALKATAPTAAGG